MKRRQALYRLIQASSGLIAASLLPACETRLDPLFKFNQLNPLEPLPDHLITPIGEFYVQSYALPPDVDINRWQLEIAGAVNHALKLTFKEITAAPQKNFYLTMECIGNPAGGDQIGNAEWTGTPLLPFLKMAGVTPEAVEFAMHGADYYETTLPIAELMRPDVYLVHQMNQVPLTKEHGYPVRIIIPGHFGQKQPKWLVKLEAIAQPKQGLWERRGWSNTAEIPTHSMPRQIQNIGVWSRKHQVSLNRKGDQGWEAGVLIGGIALDKSSPIRQIQLSTDDGKTWQRADQNHPVSPHEWTLWRYLWQPKQPGNYVIMARAESERQTQPLEDRDSMDGSSGVLRIQVTLAA
ncbi:molybdopterin-dependent oxidoreductase [Kovacikia minuta CCNUW1]|uniref:molybdopterin-dependent oxidoreductase n=1 Tax=Kovacikia minuta TaxID=2931930 RepID=UPI001CCB6B0A|nr:molybdopterin-dependent oxidoreductase [Kovacikia minuta]UBF25555.1 molybdopterin-dependent oxidoreductase [Kovacikia minuta CCNUW1]